MEPLPSFLHFFGKRNPSPRPAAKPRIGLRHWPWLLALLPLPAAATPVLKDSGAYAYRAYNTPVGKILNDFSNNFGLRLQIRPNVNVSMTANGQLSGTSATEFLDRLTTNYGLLWFHHAGTLYITRASDWSTRTIPVAASTAAPLKQALFDLGMLDSRFGWAAIPDQGIAIISGPSDYVELVARTVQSWKLAPTGQQIAVFRLKHANAEDRMVVWRDKVSVIPGMASMLRSLIQGRGGSAGALPAGEAGRLAPVSPLEPLGTTPTPQPVKTGTGADAKAPANGVRTGFEFGNAATVEADPRLNAVIVRDAPDTIALYERLIASLDVPGSMVEIEAMIVDVGKDRLEELGIDWSAGNASGSVTFGDVSRSVQAGDVSLAYRARQAGTTLASDQLSYFLSKLRVLETGGNARVVSRPTILTTDNLAALIDLSQTFYVRVTGERTANLFPVTAGVMLRVTPHLIDRPGMRPDIRLIVDIEDGALVSHARLDLPIVQRSTISTQAVIRANQSLLIGGYDSEVERDRVQGVPLLSDIPLLGALFRNTTNEKKRQERMFLITPRVIPVAGAAEAMRESPVTTPPLVTPPPAPSGSPDAQEPAVKDSATGSGTMGSGIKPKIEPIAAGPTPMNKSRMAAAPLQRRPAPAAAAAHPRLAYGPPRSL